MTDEEIDYSEIPELGDDLFGIWKDDKETLNVNNYVRGLRKGRPNNKK